MLFFSYSVSKQTTRFPQQLTINCQHDNTESSILQKFYFYRYMYTRRINKNTVCGIVPETIKNSQKKDYWLKKWPKTLRVLFISHAARRNTWLNIFFFYYLETANTKHHLVIKQNKLVNFQRNFSLHFTPNNYYSNVIK